MIDLRLGDCLTVLPEYADNTFDSIVTDPPYGLSDHDADDIIACLSAWLSGKPYTNGGKGFMGKTWDSWVPGPEVWRECYRVLKPGGYLLCFAGTRTDDLMSIAIRLAGFRKHPFLAWIFGQGFPKATNLSKMIDKAAGAEREVVGREDGRGRYDGSTRTERVKFTGVWNGGEIGGCTAADITAPATPDAARWEGWFYGLQSLKPAIEPVLMFQKPPDRAMVANVLAFGTGAINVDACRVEYETTPDPATNPAYRAVNGYRNQHPGSSMFHDGSRIERDTNLAGRWPANVIHDGSAEATAGFPVTGISAGGYKGKSNGSTEGWGYKADPDREPLGYGDTGSAARFFYAAKSSRSDRTENGTVENGHCTVKPTALMRYLVRLVTPPGGTVLDPFMGSGSTGKAAVLEGFGFCGIELELDYIEIARRRIGAAKLPLLEDA